MGDGRLLLAGNVAAALLRFGALWLVAQRAGPAVQGSLSVALAMLSFASSVLGLGLDYATAWAAGRRAATPRAIARAVLLVTAASLLLAVPWVVVFASLVPALAPDRDPLVLGLLIALVPVSTAALALQGILMGTQRYRPMIAGALLAGGGWAALLLVPAVRAAGLPGALGALLAATLVQVAWLLAAIVRADATGATTGGTTLRLLLGYGVRTVPGSVARALNLRAGLYASSAVLAPAEIGVFGLVLSIGDAYLQLPTAIGQVVLGRTAAAGAAGATTRRVTTALLGVGVLAAVAGATIGPALLALLFGPAYAAPRAVLAAVAVAVSAHAIALVDAHVLLGDGHPGSVSRAQWGALAAHGATLALLAPRFGMIGLALASLAGFVSYAALLRRARVRLVGAAPDALAEITTPA